MQACLKIRKPNVLFDREKHTEENHIIKFSYLFLFFYKNCNLSKQEERNFLNLLKTPQYSQEACDFMGSMHSSPRKARAADGAAHYTLVTSQGL